ncbi:hypothetical protein XENOCAPTIV_023855 [Xenoophorus captivus]|uniref:Uncharacterized protein n=1 Tax=Xenoophorus captivus TaxID=1517983 RepID=A0ABV0QBF5_9TELE
MLCICIKNRPAQAGGRVTSGIFDEDVVCALFEEIKYPLVGLFEERIFLSIVLIILAHRSDRIAPKYWWPVRGTLYRERFAVAPPCWGPWWLWFGAHSRRR